MNLEIYTNDSMDPYSKSLLFKWNKQKLDVNAIKNNKSLRILVDSSGSMAGSLDRLSAHQHDIKSRSQIVAESIINCAEFLNKLYHDGINIRVGLFSFNDTCKCCLDYTVIDDNTLNMVKDMVRVWTKPRGGTDFGLAFIKSHEVMSRHTEEYETILISDGHNNGTFTNEELVNEFRNTVNICIGIGSVHTYNQELFKDLTDENHVYGAKNSNELREYFVNSIFGITTKVAENIKIIIPKKTQITSPSEFYMSDNNIVINVKNFHSHRIYMLACNYPTNFKITVTYKLVKTGEYVIKHFFTNDLIIDNEKDMKIKLYCECAKKLRKSGLNQDKIKKMYESLDQFNLHENDIIDSYIIALKDEIKKLIEVDDVEEYNSLLLRTTLQTSSMNYTRHSLTQSHGYTISRAQVKDRLLCLICYNNERETIFRPCKHFTACIPCTKEYVKENKCCPLCRSEINNLYEVKIPSLKVISGFRCMDCKVNKINCTLLECHHTSLCTECAYKRIKNKDNCPYCKNIITRVIEFILS